MAAGVVCATTSNTTNNSVVTNGGDIEIYTTVTFSKPADPDPDFEYKLGSKTVWNIIKGQCFGVIDAPEVVCPGYKVTGWQDGEGNTITRDTVVDEELTVYPVLTVVTADISIMGPEEIYDGLVYDKDESGGITVADGYEYVANVAGALPTATITWTVTEGNEFVEISSDGNKLHVLPKFTQGTHSITISVSAPRVDDTIMTSEIEVTVCPPYYCKDTSWEIFDTSINPTKCYWFVEENSALLSDGNAWAYVD